jgi:hypothetical protein
MTLHASLQVTFFQGQNEAVCIAQSILFPIEVELLISGFGPYEQCYPLPAQFVNPAVSYHHEH